MGKFNELELPNAIKSTSEMWDLHLGMEVEDFITRKIENLDDSKIIGMDFLGNKLYLRKANGEDIDCEVTIVDPTYTYGIKIYGLDYNGIKYTTGSVITLYNSTKTYKLGIAMYAIITTTVITDRVGSFKAKIKYGNNSGEFVVPTFKYNDYKQEDGTINWDMLPESAIQWIDISDLFTKAQQDSNIMVSIGEGSSLETDLSKFSITNEVLTLNPPTVIITKDTSTSFTLLGNSLPANNYKLVGWCNGARVETSSLLYDQLKPGINQLVLKAVLKSGNVESEYVSTDIICTSDGYSETSVVVNKVNNTLPNNGMATLYQISVYNPNLEDVNISTYLEENSLSQGDLPINLIKSVVYTASDFLNTDNISSEQLKYIEVNSQGASRYLYVLVNGQYYNFWNISSSASTGIRPAQYKTMSVEKVDLNLTYYSDQPPLYNFDQIGGYVNNVFITNEYAPEVGLPSNIVEDIEASDGWKEENGRVFFKVSGQDKNILKSPLSLNLGNDFSIEMGFKTYNISSEDESIINLGYFLLRPTQVCWDSNNETIFKQRNAIFQEGVDNHVMITFHRNFDASGLYYPDYLQGTYQEVFNQYTGKITIAKIYINGIIDREILFTNDDDEAINTIPNWNMLLNAKSSDIDIYLFRVYNNTALNSEQVLRNYISYLAKKSDKQAFYEANDILGANGEISFEKSYKKYNTLLYVMPKGTRFPNRTTEVVSSEDGPVTLFVGYANETINKSHGGRLNYGKIKAQGSSAKKYLIHNVQYDLNKYDDPSTFIPYSLLQEDNTFPEDVATEDCYYMPKYKDLYTDPATMKVTKLVGKVNFASSMQSHKIGACKLYDDAFKNSTKSELPSGGRKAVHEEPFLYFYLETELEDVSNFQLADALKSDNIRFMGFQTWGSGKGDKATFGYDKKKTPGYIMLEGGENGDITVQFRCPWHELQRGNAAEGSTGLSTQPTCTPEYSKEKPWEYLFIDDESIVHNDEAAWDINFGCHDNKVLFLDKEDVHLSVKAFREFYDFVFAHDYNFIEVGKNNLDTNTWDTTKRYVVNNGSFPGHPEFVKAGDMYRYNIIEKAWVPAGLYCKQLGENKIWEQYNILDISGELDIEGARLWLKKDFTLNIRKYVDVDDVAFHLAFIKFMSGTDNRAKNTYFLIIGSIYEENPISETYEKSDKGDYLVRMLGDDLDTIFLTDNNGLQSKPYDLLEPSYKPEHKDYWGDNGANLFFVLFDQCFEKVSEDPDIFAVYGGTSNIKNKLKGILDFAGVTYDNVGYVGNYMYESFFKVQEKDFPAIAYNHTAKIYYENARMILNSEALGDNYNHNGVDPLTLSHGCGIGGEKLFLSKRLGFLQSYVLDITNDPSFATSNSAAGRYDLKLLMDFEPYQSFYPIWYYGKPEYILYNNNSEYDALNNMAEVGKTYTGIKISPSGEPPVNHGFGFMHLYKTLSITGLKNPTFGHPAKSTDLGKLTSLTIDNNILEENRSYFGNDYPEYYINDIKASFAVLKDLKLKNMQLPDTIALQDFYKLENLDLSGSTRVTEVIFPQSGKLKNLYLPSTLTKFRIYNNPGLQNVTFEGTDYINTVYIHCEKCGNFDVSSFIENLSYSVESITLVNCNLELSEAAVVKLANIPNCNINGYIKVVDGTEEAAISFNTKLTLVNKFGNIDSGKLRIVYKTSSIINSNITYNEIVNVYKPSNVEGEYLAPNPFGLTINSGNNVAITSEGKLNITYTMTGVDNKMATIDKYTGDIILHSESITPGKVTITITKTDGSKWSNPNPITVNFKWQAPKIGDIAYADGSFSQSYTESKEAVGIVFAIKSTKQDELGDSIQGTAHIIGVDLAADNLYLGYHYDINSQFYTGSTAVGTALTAMYNLVETPYGFGLTDYSSVNTESSNYVDNITVQSTQILSVDPDTYTGKSDTKTIVKHVSRMLDKLSIKLGSKITNYLTSDDEGNTIIKDSGSLDVIAQLLESSYPNFSTYASSLLYPYYYKMFLYQPKALILDPQYARYNWYAPSANELARVVYYRGYSALGNNFKNYHEVRANITPNIENVVDDDKIAIFSNKDTNLIKDCSVFLQKYDVAIKINSATTSSPTDGEFRSYEEVSYYDGGVRTLAGRWVYGAPDIGSYVYDYEDTVKSKHAWKLNRHSGVPFVQYKYEKPV